MSAVETKVAPAKKTTGFTAEEKAWLKKLGTLVGAAAAEG